MAALPSADGRSIRGITFILKSAELVSGVASDGCRFICTSILKHSFSERITLGSTLAATEADVRLAMRGKTHNEYPAGTAQAPVGSPI
jgi:hypothetical protein